MNVTTDSLFAWFSLAGRHLDDLREDFAGAGSDDGGNGSRSRKGGRGRRCCLHLLAIVVNELLPGCDDFLRKNNGE